jgi:hypothetical protein
MRQKVSLLAAVALAAVFARQANALVIDLKTPMEEYADLLHIQLGTRYYLLKMGYGISEIGEDYAAWIEELKRTESGSEVEVSFTVKLTEPTAFQEKPGLAESLARISHTSSRIALMFLPAMKKR